MKPDTDLSRLQRFLDTQDPFSTHLGMKIVGCTHEGVITETPLRSEFCNPHGIAHGGFLYSIADTACGMTAGLSLPYPTYEQRVVTVASSLNFFTPVTHSPVRAEARIVRTGRRIIVCDVFLYDGSGALAAKGTLTFSTIRPTASAEKADPEL